MAFTKARLPGWIWILSFCLDFGPEIRPISCSWRPRRRLTGWLLDTNITEAKNATQKTTRFAQQLHKYGKRKFNLPEKNQKVSLFEHTIHIYQSKFSLLLMHSFVFLSSKVWSRSTIWALQDIIRAIGLTHFSEPENNKKCRSIYHHMPVTCHRPSIFSATNIK